jgi:uncharacterized protein YdhG (YjbR/CyaY superfamily)
MVMPRYGSVSEYIAAQPRPLQRLLRSVRSTLRKAVPAADETISYGIPTYKLNGRAVLYFAAWKQHLSLYPSGARLVAAFRKELAPYERSKGTIRIPFDPKVPLRLVARIARFRAKEVAELEKAKRQR